MALSIRNKSSLWKVGSTAIYVPDPNVKVEHENVVGESSGRNGSGFMEIDWVRTDVRKVYLTYSYMSQSELNEMFDLLQGKEFAFHFVDRGKSATITNAYCSKSSYEVLTENYLGSGESLYKDVSFNIVER